MTLQLHRAERTDRLADGLAALLATPLPDPFDTEVISVPTPGVERWLAQSLSHRLGTSVDRADGIAAGIAFWSLHRLVGAALAHLVDPDTDPWQVDRLAWTVLAELDRSATEAWAAPIAGYLGLVDGHEFRRGRRWATARRLAGLFHRYGVQRPELIRHWLAGRDCDAAGAPLPPDRAWQPELWRRVRRTVGQPSGAERLEGACADLVAHPERIALPQRLSVFGVTRLTREQLRVLGALAEHRDVHLWLPHPSPALWDRIAALPAAGSPRRRDDPTATVAAHPFLAYLSRDSRELQQVLRTRFGLAAPSHPVSEVDRHTFPDGLLGRLQRALVTDTLAEPRPLVPGDDTIAVHAAHGPDRQVEVLRDTLVGLLADDPTLEPRDIVVMCPDIETFAPLIAAAFGLAQPEGEILGADHPGHRLRVRLADRSLRQVNPLLGLVARLLDLAQSRVTASQVLDLCATDAVMRKFGLTEDDLDSITELVRSAGVRWGVDAGHRERFGLTGLPHNTWRTGLDRILLGVTMDGSDGRHIGTTLPLDDVDSGDVDRIGRLTELFSRLATVLDQLSGSHPVGHWLTVLTEALDALAAVRPTDAWQLGHAYHALLGLAGDDPGAHAGAHTDAHGDPHGDPHADVLLGLADVRALLSDTLRGRPTRANFRTGSLTMCTMQPMRSVPHRVVCLLGVDDGVFPRRTTDDGDDLLAADPWIGDRDPRSEDRQLLLDAILAAQERLVVIYSGADPRTNATRPPAAPIGALLDAIDTTTTFPGGRRAAEAITVRHHLQPFDPGSFGAGGDHPRSFDRAALAGARALVRPRGESRSPWLVDRLPEPDTGGQVGIDDLVRFFRHPVKAFLRLRAGLYVRDTDEPDSDEIPIEPDSLEAWAIADRLLQLRLRGVPAEVAAQAEWRRGTVPPKALGAAVVEQAGAKVERVVELAGRYLTGERRSLDVDLARPGVRLTGTVRLHGDTLTSVSMGRPRAKRQLDAWIPLLAATATEPGRELTGYVIGPGDVVTLGPVPAETATTVIDQLLDVYREGLREPLPFAASTAEAYLQSTRAGLHSRTVRSNVEKRWRYDHDAAYDRFYGADADTLVLPRPLPDGTTSPSLFVAVAQRVLEPLLDARR